MDKKNLPDSLIDLALQIGDKEWFNKLCELSKEDDIEKEEYIKWSDIKGESNTIIASDNLLNKSIYLLKDNYVKIPIDKSDIENNNEFVQVFSLSDNENIKAGEEVNIAYLSTEWKDFWKIYYDNIFHVLEEQYNKYDELVNEHYKLKETNKEKDNIISKYINIVDGYKQMIQDYQSKDIKNKKKWWQFWL